MTLIASLSTPWLILQVSDRQVRQADQPINDQANKVVLYSAPDAIVVVGFAGPAMMQGIRTDQWIVEQIIDRKIDLSPFVRLAGDHGSYSWPGIQGLVERLKQRVCKAFLFDQRPTFDPTTKLEISLAGWRWDDKKTTYSPFLWHVVKEEGDLGIDAGVHARPVGSPHGAALLLIGSSTKVHVPDRVWNAITSLLEGTGTGGFDGPEFQSADNNVAGRIERILVHSIYLASKSDSRVGSNTMSIHIPHPLNRQRVEVLYTQAGRLSERSGPLDHAIHAPWIVCSSSHWPPTYDSIPVAYHLDLGWQVEVGNPVVLPPGTGPIVRLGEQIVE